MRASRRWKGMMLLAMCLCLCLPACKKDKPVAWVESSGGELASSSEPSDDDWLVFGAARHRMHFLRMIAALDLNSPETPQMARMELNAESQAKLKAELPQVEDLYARQKGLIMAKLSGEKAKLFEEEIALERETAEVVMSFYWQMIVGEKVVAPQEMKAKLEKLAELRRPLSKWLFGTPAKREEQEEMYDTANLAGAMKPAFGWPMVNSHSRQLLEDLEKKKKPPER